MFPLSQEKMERLSEKRSCSLQTR